MKSIQSLGGDARAKSMTPAERTECAQKAAEARWGARATEALRLSLENGSLIILKYPISEADYNLIMSTLALWKDKLIQPDPPKSPNEHTPIT